MPQHLKLAETEAEEDRAAEALAEAMEEIERDQPQTPGSLITRTRQSFANNMQLLTARIERINGQIAAKNAEYRRYIAACEAELEQLRVTRDAVEKAHTALLREE